MHDAVSENNQVCLYQRQIHCIIISVVYFMCIQLQHVVLSSEYDYYSHYGPEAFYAHYYATHPYYKGYYEELRIPQDQGER